jgi:hypothetical protein
MLKYWTYWKALAWMDMLESFSIDITAYGCIGNVHLGCIKECITVVHLYLISLCRFCFLSPSILLVGGVLQNHQSSSNFSFPSLNCHKPFHFACGIDSFSFLHGSYLAASKAAGWGGTPPVKPVAETSSEDQAQTPADSAVKEGSGVVGSTPTELLEKSTDNGSSKL